MSLADQIKRKLEEALEPAFLELINESDKHIGHAGHDGSGESHYRLKIVSPRFSGCGRIERQKMIYKVLDKEINGLVHALSLETLTPDEFYTL
ncbi:MAG TPA: BolA family transcriptional regulator [Hellea balneolensis]|uniref:BolA family transcriptional regulator n=1 Tax=Hellea balneolensis TaxID=287478 RepID=A0A7C3CC00_9PROT|nr:BolA family transcriptional regulator [Hellea balneolensis]